MRKGIKIFCLTVATTLLAGNMWGQSSALTHELITEGGTPKAVVTGVSSAFSGGALTIPDQIKHVAITGGHKVEINLPVVKIADNAFKTNTTLTSVDMSGCTELREIGEGAFEECINMTTVAFPQYGNLQEIKEQAFFNCTSWADIQIPCTVTTIGPSALGGTAITEVTIPASVTQIGFGPFHGCRQLEKILVEDGNPNYYASEGVLFRKNYYEPENMHYTTLIQYPAGNSRFEYYMPDDVYEIYLYSFTYTKELLTIHFNDKLRYIDEGAFSNNSSIVALYLPEGVTDIGAMAFAGCVNLRVLSLPSTLDFLGYWALSACPNLGPIFVNTDKVIRTQYSLSSGVPNQCLVLPNESVKQAYANDTYWGEFSSTVATDKYCQVGEMMYKLNDADHSATITNMGYQNIYVGCVIIPEQINWQGKTYDVKGVEPKTFKDSKQLLTLSLMDTKLTTLSNEMCSEAVSLLRVYLPNTLTEINNLAFSGCSRLMYAEIPSNVRKIGDMAYLNCTQMSPIYINSEVLEEIGKYAFKNTNIIEVVLPASLKKIGHQAFRQEKTILNVTCYATTPPVCESDDIFPTDKGFYGVLYVAPGSESAYRNATGWKGFYDNGVIVGTLPCKPAELKMVDGKLQFECATPGAKVYIDRFYQKALSTEDAEIYGDANTDIDLAYIIVYHAEAEGYSKSVSYMQYVWLNPSNFEGDINGDGVVNVGDVINLSY